MCTLRSLIVLSLAVPLVAMSAPQGHATAEAPTGGLPDLTWNGFGISWLPEILPNGLCKMSVHLKVGNIGEAPATDFWVAMFYADQMAFKQHVRGLPVGYAVTVHGTVRVKPGTYLMETYIDWHNQVAELDENNDNVDGEDCLM
jgi:hypothetical protein